jgi:hypothetical protein
MDCPGPQNLAEDGDEREQLQWNTGMKGGKEKKRERKRKSEGDRTNELKTQEVVVTECRVWKCHNGDG